MLLVYCALGLVCVARDCQDREAVFAPALLAVALQLGLIQGRIDM
jgi:hypothetical protein